MKDRFVFLDETGAKTNMKRLHGWSDYGERLVDSTPGGHWSTTTIISAIRLDGVATAMTTDGPIDALVFRPPHQNLWVNSGSGKAPRL